MTQIPQTLQPVPPLLASYNQQPIFSTPFPHVAPNRHQMRKLQLLDPALPAESPSVRLIRRERTIMLAHALVHSPFGGSFVSASVLWGEGILGEQAVAGEAG